MTQPQPPSSEDVLRWRLARMAAFDVYFASLASFQEHPGMARDNTQPKTLEDCAKRALEMLTIRDHLTGDGTL